MSDVCSATCASIQHLGDVTSNGWRDGEMADSEDACACSTSGPCTPPSRPVMTSALGDRVSAGETAPELNETGAPPNETMIDGISIRLEEDDLWHAFHTCGTEMIINRPGRRMFPSVVVSVSGLDPNALYQMLLEVVPLDDRRYKYINNHWVPIGKSDPEIKNPPYVHPDSPSQGSFWMQTKMSFSKVKITNSRESAEGNMVIHSMHKYMVRLLVLRMRGDGRSPMESVFRLPLTTFIAVTAYQNEQITKMKIRNNPFAKAFRDGDISTLIRKDAQEIQSGSLRTRDIFNSGAFAAPSPPLSSGVPTHGVESWRSLGMPVPGWSVNCPWPSSTSQPMMLPRVMGVPSLQHLQSMVALQQMALGAATVPRCAPPPPAITGAAYSGVGGLCMFPPWMGTMATPPPYPMREHLFSPYPLSPMGAAMATGSREVTLGMGNVQSGKRNKRELSDSDSEHSSSPMYPHKFRPFTQ